MRPTGRADDMMRKILLGAGLVAAMAAPLPAQPQPVALKGGPGRWTINGNPVLDELLQLRLRMIFETRADKRLYFATAASSSYERAVGALAMARMTGVEELVLLSENGRIEDGLVVSDLVPLPGLDTDLRLPVSDGYGLDRTATDVEVTLRAAGAEPDGLDRASGAPRVLLRADAGLTYGDVLRALRQAKERGARALSLAVQKPNGPGEMKRRCEAGQMRDCGSLGTLYLSGLAGAPKAPATGLSLVRKACGAAERESCEMLARLMWHGEYVPKDRDEAVRLFTDNCRAGLESSCRVLRSEGLAVPSRGR